ncbi:hypothetical protein [Falsiroseomonas oryzae]|uniref:hypothetical protein n=1 Tax=Falsiroseomonas oryzae TaxID=2766473 RepID=UPI0022EA85E3|nr:hypothetical protein [Roseomonas sp. MO-31]
MLDHAGAAADLDLLLSPGDAAEFVALSDWRCRDGRVRASQLWVVLHRRHGDWTHAYRVVRDRRPGHLAVYLERAAEGDRRAELRDWLAARAGAAD